MRRSERPIEPVRKTRTVPIEPQRAFDLFTARIGTWWPLASHSIAEADAVDVRFEPRVGGRVIEVTKNGGEHPWADVIAWDPPHRFVVAWHPSVEPDAATILEVRFIPTEDGGTQVELEHREWEELGPSQGDAVRGGYESGWDSVLSVFEAAALASD